ncbi:putative disease resistance protein RGA3 [Camellia lanceoleosa]|uniref:Disease resistance protein RGA3 n=1 Tax=Camellia lanceoleosa TaxID=1840588 RepID=A0ACC0FKU3_9ERIC|nr:putative disease resistance protein RGA3 [Camellia lanceoleosa]
MGDAVLSAFMQVVFQQLASPLVEEFGLLYNLERHLKKLSRLLTRARAVICDAEQRQSTEQAVAIWLADLKDVAYDADNILDEMSTQVLLSKFQVPGFFSSINPKQVFLQIDLALRIDEVIGKLEDIAQEREDLHLKEGVVSWNYNNKERLQTSSLIDEFSVFGRSDDKEEIVSLLMLDDSRGREFYGEGGVGFASLEMLEMKDMPNLAYWAGAEAGEIPCLRELTIWDCPLMIELPNLPCTLTTLEIVNCRGFKSFPMLHSIQNLIFGQCDEDQSLGKLSSLEDLEICCCPKVTSLKDENLPNTLKSLRVVSCPSFTSLPDEIQNLSALEVLEICNCPQLRKLPEREMPAALQLFWVRRCPALKARCQDEELNMFVIRVDYLDWKAAFGTIIGRRNVLKLLQVEPSGIWY